jgi:transposase
MPNFKPLDYSPRFLAVDLSRQLVPGTFEDALHQLLEHEIELPEIEARYRNDEVGASAYEPRVLLKIILLAYSYGIVSSRAMQAACGDNVRFIAPSGDCQPDHSTLASFVSGLGEAMARVFTQVLMVCDRQGLIGREMFAIDGVKLPSNASKAKRGKRKDFVRQAQKMEQAMDKILRRHRDNDVRAVEAHLSEREKRQIERLKREAKQINEWLQQHPRSARAPRAAPAVQPHRQRVGQDAHRQRRGARLQRGGGGR